MNIELRYAGKAISGFDELLQRYPGSQFDSPRRSTVSLLAYWRDTSGRGLGLLRRLWGSMPENLVFDFECEVPVQAGHGKPSCTDLMVTTQRIAVAIEGKYLEPPYETVSAWLGTAPSDNRKAVLNGWFSLINRVTGSRLTDANTADITYQAIHRVASACWPSSGTPGVARFAVYQCFVESEDAPNHYVEHLSALRALIPPERLKLAVAAIQVVGRPAYRDLLRQWDQAGRRDLRTETMNGLRGDALFEFREPRVMIL